MLTYSFLAQAQQPSHYIIGEEELAETDIYTSIQDKEANVWLGTDRGLFKYDSYTFTPYHNVAMKSKSLFRLTANQAGQLFCHNLAGQIFTIQDDSLHLFYEIPDSLLSTHTHLNFDNQDNLIVYSKGLFSISPQKQLTVLFYRSFLPGLVGVTNLCKTATGNVVFALHFTDSIGIVRNNQLSWKVLKNYPSGSYYNNCLSNDKDIVLTLSARRNGRSQFCRLSQNLDSLYFMSYIKTRIDVSYLSHQQQLWNSIGNNGAYVLDIDGKPLYNNQFLFKDYFISGAYEDREDNLCLTTLGRGIIVIPTQNIIDYAPDPIVKDELFKTLTQDEAGNIYLGGKSGDIYIKKRDSTTIKKWAPRPINKRSKKLFHIPVSNSILSYNERSWLFNIHDAQLSHHFNNFQAIKDAYPINDSLFLFSTSAGIELLNFTTDTSALFYNFLAFDLQKTRYKQFPFPRFCFPIGRTLCIAYNRAKNVIWAGQNKGLICIHPQHIDTLSYQNRSIIANDIELQDNFVWVATSSGLLQFKNQKVTAHITTGDGLLSNEISQLKIKGHLLYLATQKGFQVYDTRLKVFQNFRTTDGAISNAITDFLITDAGIWLTSSKGLQFFRFEDLTFNEVPPILSFSKLIVNDAPYAYDSTAHFNYERNRFEFHFIAKGYRHRGTLSYQYRLQPIEKQWKISSFRENYMKYPGLAPGQYTFEVQAINESGVKSKTLRYNFVISPPFTQTWTFYLLCFVSIIAIVSIFFLIRIAIIKRRLILERELKSSKITAIKAQMNPHFVFNTLNSVQDLIMMEDIRSSNIYLGKFADMMRKTLRFSDKEYISLSEEVDLLQLYLDLEQLRFEEDFKYNITLDFPNEQAEQLMVPAMLLQPYVENAIKHGLLHKKGLKILSIHFHIAQEHLVCKIEDNGIGRKASHAINQRRRKYHQSFASEANKKRIELVNENSKKPIFFEIIDNYDQDGNATGTTILFKFPIEYN